MNRNVALLASIYVCVITSWASAVDESVRWRSGGTSIPTLEPAAAAERLLTLAESNPGVDLDRIVVRFDGPLSTHERGRLGRNGVILLKYLGDHTYFAALSKRQLRVDEIAAVGRLRAAVDIDRNWKLHPTLIAGEIVPWSIVGDSDDSPGVGPNGSAEPASSEPDRNPIVGAYVLFHSDVDLSTQGVPIAMRHVTRIRSELHTVNGLVVELPYASIANLADEDTVQYIEPPLPKMSGNNDSNRAITGADLAQTAPYNLDGTGISVLVYDGGNVLTTHPDLVGRVITGDSAGISDHSTHVAGTVGGTGSLSAGLRRGMAPNVTIISYGFETAGPLEAGFLYTDPGDIEADYGEAISLHGADISSNSIGSNTAPNGFPCSWEGDYGVTAGVIDGIVRGSLGSPFRIVWACGNERSSGRCGATFFTTAPPANSKNMLSVGAVNSNDDSISYFTSFGPSDDGRIRPDIVAPGCQLTDDNGVTSTSSSGSYNVKCGTSMATPTVSGMSALLLQDYRAQYPGEPDFRNSTLKAFYAQTAVDLDDVGPDYRSGYGSVRIVPAIEQMRSGNWLENSVDQNDIYTGLIIVEASDPQLKVTLAWDDAPGAPNVIPSLVNDLDLRVFDAAETRYYPWTLNPAMPDDPAVQTQEDHLNNIEQVVIDSPAPGAYIVEVVGFNVPDGPQSFSLVAGPQLIDCTTRGIARVDRTAYPCQSTIELEVVDCDLNTDDQVVETVMITISSNTEAGGETVTLTETGSETAQFEATIAIDTTDSPGVLHVTEGDTVTATYVDADDGFGGINVVVEATAVVDCTDPVISNVAAVDIDEQSARITFNTDEPAVVAVHFGLSCGALSGTVQAGGFNTSHSLTIPSLFDDTPYFYSIEAEDPAGNIAIDDNGAACYSFQTEVIPDYFTEQFTSGLDVSNRRITYVPDAGPNSYVICSVPAFALPTDPTGGTNLVLSDDGSGGFPIPMGDTVKLYGVSYGAVFINANGNLTFDTIDSDATETIEEHFGRPRVSALFDDLDPSEGGSVSFKILADRVAVTWLNVPEDGTGNSNTAQIEMFFDGQIQITWLEIGLADAIVGLSEGLGVPFGFFQTDYTQFVPCGPIPPSAMSASIGAPQDRPLTITLATVDDGLPNPPGALDHIVTSLPTHPLRDAGNGHTIVPGDLPYTLVNNGNQVIYLPPNGFTGPDGFQFHANDGGVPPDGGDSNSATVSIDVQPVIQLPFFDDFVGPGFDSARWAEVDDATIDDVGEAEPSPPNSARFNADPDGGDLLLTNAIDLSLQEEATLEYDWERTGNGNSPETGEDLTLEYLDNLGQWQVLQQHDGDGLDMTSYMHEVIPLPAAALHGTFRLRISCTGTDGAFDDWFVDDVSITGVPILLGDINDDDLVDLNDIGPFVDVMLGTPQAPEHEDRADLNNDGLADAKDVQPFVGALMAGP